MKELYEELILVCNENNYTDDEINSINKAYEYAKEIHKGMKRKNGDDYITHPLNVALIVAKLNADATTVISGLLHETIEHGSSSSEEIERIFGSEVREIVDSLDKVNRLHLIHDTESSSQYLRKVLVALSEDVRVIILKLAGRIHNLETNDALSKELQHQKAIETWNVLIPIAHRLGINELKSRLEDLSFKYLKPDAYEEIEQNMPISRLELEKRLNEVTNSISDMLKNNDLKFEIKCRVKSVASIYNKLSKGKKWSEIYDILGIRIICYDEAECYFIIGLIHAAFRPIPHRFKDYIAVPKGNSYQSLHTGIYGPDEMPIEVQVRTKEMNEIAEHGVASHWSYKEHGRINTKSVMEQKLQMFRNIIDVNSTEIKNDDEFADYVSEELLKETIYVYTPKGDVVELPLKSTPIDFAYRIHSKVGDTTVGAIVNDSIVPLNYELQDNDVVKIMTKEGSKPNRDWLNMVKTVSAKSKIKAFFSKQMKEEYIKKGRELLEQEIKHQKLSINDALNSQHIEKLLHDLKVGSIEEVYFNIGSLRYTPLYIVNLIYNEKNMVTDVLMDKVSNYSKASYKNNVIVSGYDDILVNLASCCKPILGDNIIGYITKGEGIIVHKSDCPNALKLNERLIDVSWNDNVSSSEYLSKIFVYTNGLKEDTNEFLVQATKRNIIVSSINKINQSNHPYFEIIIKVKNKHDLDLYIDDIKSLSFVERVKR